MSRWRTTKEKEAAQFVITSKRTAEIFIKNWVERNDGTREAALKRLKKIGIEYADLPDEDVNVSAKDAIKRSK